MQPWFEACVALPVWSYEKDDAVIREDQKDGRLYILKSGSVEVQRREMPVTQSANRGSVYGEISVLLDRPATAGVVALEPCEFYVAEDGLAFATAHPDFGLHLARLMAQRLLAATDLALDLHERLRYSEEWEPSSTSMLRSLADHLAGHSFP